MCHRLRRLPFTFFAVLLSVFVPLELIVYGMFFFQETKLPWFPLREDMFTAKRHMPPGEEQSGSRHRIPGCGKESLADSSSSSTITKTQDTLEEGDEAATEACPHEDKL